MTRETKIGLLVGLAFIIVIGILLSDHLTSTLQPPQAPLSVAATNVREGLNTPGIGNVSQDAPVQVAEVAPNPVVIGDEAGRAGRTEVTILPPSLNGGRDVIIPDNSGRPADHVVLPPPQNGQQPTRTVEIPTALEQLVRENPGEIIAVPLATDAAREYRAEPGDTISMIARRQLGADTIANRNAILKLNPSLRNDPRNLRAGETYLIPVAREAANPPALAPPAIVPVGTPTAPADENFYTTRSGDTLWRIAVTHVGSHAAVQQIKDLNRDILKGGDRIKPGMKLRLPSRSLPASSQANSSI